MKIVLLTVTRMSFVKIVSVSFLSMSFVKIGTMMIV